MTHPRRGRKATELPEWGRWGEGERQGTGEPPYSHNATAAPWPSVFNALPKLTNTQGHLFF